MINHITNYMQPWGIIQERQKQDTNNDGIKEETLTTIGSFRFYWPTDTSAHDYRTLGVEIEQTKEFWKLYAVDIILEVGKTLDNTKKITIKGQTYDILKVYPVHYANWPLHHYKLYIRTRQK